MARPDAGRAQSFPLLVVPPKGKALAPWLTTVVDDDAQAMRGWRLPPPNTHGDLVCRYAVSSGRTRTPHAMVTGTHAARQTAKDPRENVPARARGGAARTYDTSAWMSMGPAGCVGSRERG